MKYSHGGHGSLSIRAAGPIHTLGQNGFFKQPSEINTRYLWLRGIGERLNLMRSRRAALF